MKEQSFIKFSDFLERKEYLRKTSNSFEKKINKANVVAGQNSGRPSYPELHKIRQGLLKKAEENRPLRRSEYIDLYSYEKWKKYTDDNKMPESSKWADAHIKK